MKDGSPHVVPTWVDIDNGTLLVNTAVGRVKQKNILRDSRVALAIADHDNPYNMVTIRGHDSSFLGMVTIFSATIVGNKKVTVVFSGSVSGSPPTDKEIDQVIVPG